MDFEESFINGCGSWRFVSQWLWISKSCFSMVVDLKEPFSMVVDLEESFLNYYGTQRVICQWWLWNSKSFFSTMVVDLKESFLNSYGSWRAISQWLWILKGCFSMVNFGDSQAPIKHKRSFLFLHFWSKYVLKSFLLIIFFFVNIIVLVIFLPILLCHDCIIRLPFYFHSANNQIGNSISLRICHW